MEINTSSALPPGSQALPLSESLRKRIPPEVLKRARLRYRPGEFAIDEEASDFIFRNLTRSDRNALKLLHEELFPIRYADNFYDSCVDGEHYAVGAVIKPLRTNYWFRPLANLYATPLVAVGIVSFNYSHCLQVRTRFSLRVILGSALGCYIL